MPARNFYLKLGIFYLKLGILPKARDFYLKLIILMLEYGIRPDCSQWIAKRLNLCCIVQGHINNRCTTYTPPLTTTYPHVRIPWTTGCPNLVVLAYSLSTCIGLVSPEILAKQISDSEFRHLEDWIWLRGRCNCTSNIHVQRCATLF